MNFNADVLIKFHFSYAIRAHKHRMPFRRSTRSDSNISLGDYASGFATSTTTQKFVAAKIYRFEAKRTQKRRSYIYSYGNAIRAFSQRIDDDEVC